MTREDTPLTYRDAGVDIAAADAFVHGIGAMVKATHLGRVRPGMGAYAGLIDLPVAGMTAPLLAATCDGVGTKLLVARDTGRFDGLGQDLVAMNVNDLLPVGARPLLFLDYIATGKVDAGHLTTLVRGMAEACRATGCALLGGETAEMPGLYPAGDFDLAGFAVGVVDATRVPRPETVTEGDVILGLPSSGLHSNGYSLARRALLERGGLRLDDTVPALGVPLAEALLTPTRLYVNEVSTLMSRVAVKTSAHVTGGGLLGRLAKLAPAGLRSVVDPARYPRPPLVDLIGRVGNVAVDELARTFNMGLGFVVVVTADDARRVARELPEWLEVGVVRAGAAGVELGYASV